MSTLVPTLCWIPKGVAKEVPDKVELSAKEVQRLLEDAKDQLSGLDIAGDKKKSEELSTGSDGAGGRGEEVEEGDETIEELYDMDNYDSDEGKGESVCGAGMGNHLSGLMYYPSNDNDPYITLKKSPEEDENEDYRVLPSDNLLVIGRAEEDFSSIEIHVFSEPDDHSYSHHEILLTSFPLALEWLDYDPEQPDQKGNYIAVGSMAPVIEVWDLDTIDVLEPVFCLGDPNLISGGVKKGKKEKQTEKERNRKKKKGSKLEDTPTYIDGHTNAVLGLSWNRVIRNVLASASADSTVRVWDMTWPKCILTLKHPDKVQCCMWHPYQPELLATGTYDGIVRLFNCKSSESTLRSWNLESEVEKVLWNHFKPEQLLASSEDKTVWCFNKDDGSTVFQIHAHNSAITDLTLNCYLPGLLVTASVDDTIKFWDIHENKPVFLLSKDMHMGAIMCAKFASDSPYSLAVGGKKNGFHIINVQRLLPVMQCFKKRKLLVPVLDASSDESGDRHDNWKTADSKKTSLKIDDTEEESMEVSDVQETMTNSDKEMVSTSKVKTKISTKKKKKNFKTKRKAH